MTDRAPPGPRSPRPRSPGRHRRAALAALALLAATTTPALAAPRVNVVPEPQSVEPLGGRPVRLADGAAIIVAPGDAEAMRVARYLSDLALKSRGLRLVPRYGAPAAGAIALVRRPAGAAGDEAYGLTIGDHRVVIAAARPAGLFYGAVTLWQLMTPDADQGPVSLAAVRIQDRPRFGWRGLMLDSARHYQSPAFIERLIDQMALHKLNVLHWHLTDDQAWRLEIRKYPKLAQVGGWRTPAGAAAQADIDPATGRPRLYGGVYSQDQVREIVAYAAARHIVIVPEIEMPGHALSAILAYPELGSAGAAPASIQGDWGVFPYLYNVDDHTFAVLEDVLTEVMALFPGAFIHIGGDEATKDQWKASPQIQARMKALGIADEDGLQSYFTHRISAFLTAHGRRPIGWDEILQGGPLPPAAAVMSWHGVDGALAAARAGHDAVLAPAPVLYFDNRQSDRPDEPAGRGYVVSLKDVYAFDPAPGRLTVAERRRMLGLQANLWTEHVRTEDQVEAMVFPRAAAVAEAGWTAQPRRDWADFQQRLPAQMDRYRVLGIKADDAALAVRAQLSPGAAPQRAQVILANQTGFGQIRYATDGGDPGPGSPAYAAPLDLPLNTTLKAATFQGARAVSGVTTARIDAATIRARTSQDLKLCAGKLPLNLVAEGASAVMMVDILDPCWIWSGADLSGVRGARVSIGQVPFNFQIGADRDTITLRPPATASGELEVRLDRCDGPPAAVAPLDGAGLGLTELSLALPPVGGRHDLCFSFTAHSLDPLWAVNRVQLLTKPAGD